MPSKRQGKRVTRIKRKNAVELYPKIKSKTTMGFWGFGVLGFWV